MDQQAVTSEPLVETPPSASTSSAAAAPSTSASAAGPSAPAIKVYKPVSAGAAIKLPELPDSYYNPTASELRAAHAGQANRLIALGVDTNFSTRAQRDKDARAREAKRVNRFPKTVVRIRFADRHQIETTFPSSKTIQAVYDFARSALAEEAQSEPFILYVPPRTELKLNDPKIADKSLLDLQLAPSSVLLIRFANDSLNDASRLAPLLPFLLSEAEELPKPPTFDPTPEQLAAKQAEGAGRDDPADKEKKGNTLGSGSGAKVPKWLQKVSGSELAKTFGRLTISKTIR